MLRFLRNRELNGSQDLSICPLEKINIASSKLTIMHLESMTLGLPMLTELKLKNCVGLRDQNITRDIVDLISRLSNLRVLDIESTTFLQPGEACRINWKCHNLTQFWFSPVWKRIRGGHANPTNIWVEIYESEPQSKWGPDFGAVYMRVKHNYYSAAFLKLYNDGPEWALTDSESESD